MTIRVVLAEDNEIMRRGILRLLNGAQDIKVVGEAKDGVEALSLVKEQQPDVLLLDVEMPRLSGIEVARRLKKEQVKPIILVLSAYDDRQYILEMQANGVSAYLLKDDAPVGLVDTVHKLIGRKTGALDLKVASRIPTKNK